MRHTLTGAGARGHHDLKWAIKKESETTPSDELVNSLHKLLPEAAVIDRLAPNQKLAPKWPQLQYAAIPEVDIEDFRLSIQYHGEPLHSLSFGQLWNHRERMNLVDVDFHCVTGWSILGVNFNVIPLMAFYRAITPHDKRIFAKCIDGFSSSIQISLRHDTYICFGAFGKPLEPKHGFPVRLLVPSRYGFKSGKWIDSVNITEDDSLGFWELRGYDDSANPWLEERFAGKTGKDGLTAAQRAKREVKKEVK